MLTLSNVKPRLRADAARNRQSALDAAKALLAEPDAILTVETIAARAGVSPATVVRAFGGKEALIDAAVSELLMPLVQRARGLPTELPPDQALRTFLGDLIAFQSAYHTMNVQVEALTLPASEAAQADLYQVGLEMVTRGREAGAIRTDLDLGTTMTLISECTYAIARSRANSPDLTADFLTLLMDGLHPRAPGDGSPH